MKKLKLIPPVPPEKKAPEIVKPTGYESPIGWWSVSTDGDCEGRSTRQLGEYYGHVAEIAFHLADKAMYDIGFHPIRIGVKGKRQTYQATRDKVWIQLGIDSKTWDMTPEARAKWFEIWLDCPDDIDVAGSTAGCSYFGAVHLTLKK